MVLSLAVVLAGVVVFFVFVMPHGGDEPEVRPVETEVALTSFAGQAPYPVSAPEDLPDYWTPTSIRVKLPSGGTSDQDASMVTIGYVVDRPDDRRFARFLQSNVPDAVQRNLGDRPITGTVDVAGEAWEERRDGEGHLALTRTMAGVTTIVDDGGGKGGADEADLRTLAASVRPIETGP